MTVPQYHPKQSVTKHANQLVYGDRGAAYSHPLTDYRITAKLWTAILHSAGKLPAGVEINAYEAALCMGAMKLSRASRNQGHQDSLVDIAGYAEVANEIALAEKDEKDAAGRG